MAIYHLSASVGSRSGGQSAGAKADYLARQNKYRREREEVALVVSANMPSWVRDPDVKAGDYWRLADQAERANGVLFRQVEFALPSEMPPEERQALARQFADELATVEGGRLPYTLAIHEKAGNPHAHLILSERINDGIERDRAVWFKRAAASPKGKEIDPAKGGAKKADIASRRKDWLAETRERWTEVANAALDRGGHGAISHIDHRSHADRGLVRPPGQHLGPQASGYEARTGKRSDRGRRLDARAELRRTIAPGITTRTPSVRRDAPLVVPVTPAPIAITRPATAERTLAATLDLFTLRQQARQHRAVQAVAQALPAHLTPVQSRPAALAPLRTPAPIAITRPATAEAALATTLDQVAGQHRTVQAVAQALPAHLTPVQSRPAALAPLRTPAPITITRPATAEAALAATLAAQHDKEKRRGIDQRRAEHAGKTRVAGGVTASGDRQLREGRRQAERAERAAIGADQGAQQRELAPVGVGITGESAGGLVSQRWGRIRAAHDRDDQAARRRAEVVDSPSPQPPTLAERIAASLAAMVEWIKSIGGELRDVAPSNTYVGTIRHADEHHVVQSGGGGWYYIHRQADLPQPLQPDPDTIINIRYGRDGRVGGVEAKARGGLGNGRV